MDRVGSSLFVSDILLKGREQCTLLKYGDSQIFMGRILVGRSFNYHLHLGQISDADDPYPWMFDLTGISWSLIKSRHLFGSLN